MKRHRAGLIRAALEESPHFRGLAPDDLQALAAIGRPQNLRAGEPCKGGLALILGGTLRVTSVTSQGQEIVYAHLGRGEFFGLGELVHASPSPLTAHAAGSTSVVMFPAGALRAVLDARPSLWRHLAGLLYERLVQTLLLARDLSVAPLSQRLASRLLWQALAASHGGSTQLPITVNIGQSDLARMLGTGRSAVNAALRRLERAGTVKIGYRSVALLDTTALRRMAGPDLALGLARLEDQSGLRLPRSVGTSSVTVG